MGTSTSYTVTARERRQSDRVVVDWVLAHADTLPLPPEVLEVLPKIKRLRAAKGSGLGRVDNYFFLSCLMNEKLVWTESEIFTRFGITRAVMSAKRASAFKFCPDPEKRIWMTLDKVKREYKFLDMGEDVPTGYSGPLPVGYVGGNTVVRDKYKDSVVRGFEEE